MFRQRVTLPGACMLAAAVFFTAGCAAQSNQEVAPDTRIDLLTATIRCMEEQGFEAEADGSGGFSGPEMSAELSDQWRAVAEECAAKTGWGVEEYDDEQLAELYTLEVDQYECLIELGYAPSEPPSLQSYIDSWSSRTDSPYQPFGSVIVGLTPEEQATMLKECPPPRWSFTG